MGKTSKVEHDRATAGSKSAAHDDSDSVTSAPDSDWMEIQGTEAQVQGSESLISAILSGTNQHMALVLYMDSRIAKVRREYNTKLTDIQDSLVCAQAEIETIKNQSPPVVPRSQCEDGWSVAGAQYSRLSGSIEGSLTDIKMRLDRIQEQVNTLETRLYRKSELTNQHLLTWNTRMWWRNVGPNRKPM